MLWHGVDGGPIIAKLPLDLSGHMKDIFERLFISSTILFSDFINNYPLNIKTFEQNNKFKKYKRLKPKDSELDKENCQSTLAMRCEEQVYQREIILNFYNDIKDYDVFLETSQIINYPMAFKSFCFLLDFIYCHNPNLTYKINLNSPLETITSEVPYSFITIGLHGIKIEFSDGRAATYLASVMVDYFKFKKGQIMTENQWRTVKESLKKKCGSVSSDVKKIYRYECIELKEGE